MKSLTSRLGVLALLILGGTLQVRAATHADLLRDQYDRPVPAARLAGQWLLVYFGYAQCPDICPAALARLNVVLARMGPAASRVLPVFISLDPEHDTPARLKEFADRFNSRLLALTGTPSAVADAAARFGVVWRKSSGGRGVDHEALWYLVSPDSRIVRTVYPTQPIDEIVDGIRASLDGRDR